MSFQKSGFSFYFGKYSIKRTHGSVREKVWMLRKREISIKGKNRWREDRVGKVVEPPAVDNKRNGDVVHGVLGLQSSRLCFLVEIRSSS